MSATLVNVLRGDRIESVHSGSVAVVDARGRLVAYAGDPGHSSFLRSSAKPFQILPFLAEGGADEFDLTGEEIALICASHGGETRHVATAAAILRKGEFDETDLLCGAHAPLEERAAAELRLSGAEPSPLHNNCSGKHAGMLLYCEMLDVSTESYLDRDHPIQVDILNTLASFTWLEPEEIPLAVDGCGVPTFHLSVYRAALAWARLAATGLAMDEPRSVPDVAPHARLVLDSMTRHPYYVAGGWSITTPLIESFEGDLVGKEGAEGFYGMAVFPPLGRAGSRPELFEEGPLGIAIKIADGTMARARDPVIIETLRQLGIDSSDKERLQGFARPTVKNVAGLVVGAIEPAFSLELL
jgi:L-asparaginase II